MGAALQTSVKRGKLYVVRDGFLVCPNCRRNKRLMRIDPKTRAVNLAVWCRDCKNEIMLDIDQGQCFESRSQ